jgi:hypothetical protein
MGETTKGLEESHWIFYTCQERFIQGLACLPIIHPSLNISPWSSQASPMEILRKIGRENNKANELGFQELVAIPQLKCLYGGNWKTKLPLLA